MARLIGAEGRRSSGGAVRRDEAGRWVDTRKSAPPPRDERPGEPPPPDGLSHIHPRHHRASLFYGLVMLIAPVVLSVVAIRDPYLTDQALAGTIDALIFFGLVGLTWLIFLPFASEALFGLASVSYDHRGLTYTRWGRARFRPWASLSQAGVLVQNTGRGGRRYSIGFRELPGSASGFEAPPLDRASASVRIPGSLFFMSKSRLDDLVADINSVRAQVLSERLVQDIAATGPKG